MAAPAAFVAREWCEKNFPTLGFLTPDMTLGQASLKWLLADPLVITTLPNIDDTAQLREFAAASDQPDLTPRQLDQVGQLAAVNFGVEEPPMAYKGTMERENVATA